MTPGAPNAGTGAATVLAAHLAEATKGGERRLGVALIGLGRYSRGELGPALQQTNLCRLAGVVTGAREKGADWSRQYGFPERNVWNYDAVAEIAGRPDIDVIYVATPNGLHAEHVVAAAAAGKHVICEKPMASTVAECDAMLAACDRAGVKLSIGYRLQFDPYHQELERLAREHDFGPLTRLSGELSWTFRTRAWRIERSLSGGGPLMDIGIYVIQAACRAARALPVAVVAHELPKTNPALFNEVEEAIEWTMEFPGGVTCQGVASYTENRDHFRAEGDRGWFQMGPAFAYRGLQASTPRGGLHYPPVSQQALQMDDFAACILVGRESPVPGTMGRDHQEILAAVYASAAAGGRRTLVKRA